LRGITEAVKGREAEGDRKRGARVGRWIIGAFPFVWLKMSFWVSFLVGEQLESNVWHMNFDAVYICILYIHA